MKVKEKENKWKRQKVLGGRAGCMEGASFTFFRFVQLSVSHTHFLPLSLPRFPSLFLTPRPLAVPLSSFLPPLFPSSPSRTYTTTHPHTPPPTPQASSSSLERLPPDAKQQRYTLGRRSLGHPSTPTPITLPPTSYIASVCVATCGQRERA